MTDTKRGWPQDDRDIEAREALQKPGAWMEQQTTLVSPDIADDNCEGWEALAIALCEEEGHEPFELLWDGGAVPEPWGDRWMNYEDDAKRMIGLVRTHVVAPSLPARDGLTVAVEALKRLAEVPGCGCSFPCRCGGAEWTRIELEGRMDVAAEALKSIEALAAPRQPGEVGTGVPGHEMTAQQYAACAEAASAQQDEREALSDAKRLEWVSKNWGGQRPDYAMHVIDRGGDGDLSDIRTFIDKQL